MKKFYKRLNVPLHILLYHCRPHLRLLTNTGRICITDPLAVTVSIHNIFMCFVYQQFWEHYLGSIG